MVLFKKLTDAAQVPRRQTGGAAGFDLHISESVLVPVGGSAIARTGISASMPPGCVGILKDRSGEAANHGITVLAGVIDEDYRGEVKVVLHNLGEQPRQYHIGDRIAQMVVVRYEGDSAEAFELDHTERSFRGFGSTGV